MENHIFAVQDGTQLTRVLSIIANRKVQAKDFLVVLNTGRGQNKDFYQMLFKISSAHKWEGLTIINEMPIPDSLDYYLPNREVLTSGLKAVVDKEFGARKYSAIYSCRNWQWGADCFLRAFGANATKYSFGDSYGMLDVRKDPRYIKMDVFSATLPMQGAIDRGYEIIESGSIPISIIHISTVKGTIKRFSKMNPHLYDKLTKQYKNDRLLFINTTTMTECRALDTMAEEMHYYKARVADVKNIVSENGITKIIIKPHPREANRQSIMLAEYLKDFLSGMVVQSTSEIDAELAFYPVEFIAEAMPVVYSIGMGVTFSSMALSVFQDVPYKKNEAWEVFLGNSALWDYNLRFFIQYRCAELALNNWDNVSFLNPRLTHPDQFDEMSSFYHDKIIKKIHGLVDYYRGLGMDSIVDILESEVLGGHDALRRVCSVHYGDTKVKGDLDCWKKEGQPSEFMVHKDDPYRQSQLFDDHSAAIFKQLGFSPDSHANKVVVDIGAGSKLRTKYFKGAHLVVIEPLANRYTNEITWCDLKTAQEVYSEPAEKLIRSLVGKADLVVSINVLDHCFDFDTNVSNISKYLKLGGIAALSFDLHFYTDEQHPLILNKEICVEAFEKHGLVLERYSEGVENMADFYGHGPSPCMNFILRKNVLADEETESTPTPKRGEGFDLSLTPEGAADVKIDLSICIPTFNRLPFLQELIASIHSCSENQKLPIEIVISETSSDDGTDSYIREIAPVLAEFLHVRVISRKEKVDWMDHMFEMPHFARGEFVWIIGDDDVILPDGLITVLNNLKSLNCDVLLLNKLVANKDLSAAILQKQHDIAGPFLTYSLADLCGRFGLMTEVGFTSALIYRRQPVLQLSTEEWFRTRSTYAQSIRLLEPFSKSLCAAIDDVVIVHRQGNQRSGQSDVIFDEVTLWIPRCLVLLLRKGAVVPDQISAMLEESAPGDGEYITFLSRLDRIALGFRSRFSTIRRHVLYQGWVELAQRINTPFVARILDRLFRMLPPESQEPSFPTIIRRNVGGFDLFEYQGWYHAISVDAGPVNLEKQTPESLAALANEALYFYHWTEEGLISVLKHNIRAFKQ